MWPEKLYPRSIRKSCTWFSIGVMLHQKHCAKARLSISFAEPNDDLVEIMAIIVMQDLKNI
jgi:hypothetical protein